MFWKLPTTLTVAGRSYDINSDFRIILEILATYGNPDLSEVDKMNFCLSMIYKDVDAIPVEHIAEAYTEAVKFIDNGQESDKNNHRTMDWEQDAALFFPAVNHVAGFEVRSAKYLHWHTFLGYFMEIRDGVFSAVLRLRQKKEKHQKLDKAELEFWQNNRRICELPKKLTAEEQAEYDRFNALFS